MNPEKPNNFSKPEQPQENLEKGVVVKIEARKAKDILDDLYYGEPDYGDYDYPDEPHDTEEEKKESLPYTPFDASQSLRDLRKLSPEEKALPPVERRELLRSRLEALKDNLRQQNIGIASIIRDLQKIVEVNPDTTIEELLSKVREAAPQYRLSESQINIFKYALEDYEQKHEMVEKYRTTYPEDADLFEACFGRKPVGEIKVIKLPMTLHFQCFSLDDYALAYNQFKLKKDTDELTEEDKQKADLSGGAALASVRIEELKGVVTIENARGRIVDFEQVPTKRTEIVKETPLELYLPEQKEDIQISAEGAGKWELQVVERDERNEPLRLRLLDPNGDAVFDARFVEPSEELKEKYFILYKILEDVDGEKAKYASMGGFLKSGQQSYGYYHIQGAFLKFDAFSQGLKVEYTTNQLVPIMSKEGSERIRIHEEQHQFNKLFVPWEIRLGRYKIMMDAAERAKTPQEAKEIVVRGLVKERRQDIMDRRARDEIIAYYRDGRNTDEIFTTLTESPLYDYFDQSKERIGKLPEEIVKEIEEEMSEVMYQKEPDEKGFAGYVVDAVPLQVDEDLVRKNIEPVFKDEYKKDLRRWLDAVALLERKGYQREEIVSLLAQEPVRSWNALSRRLVQKEKELVQ